MDVVEVIVWPCPVFRLDVVNLEMDILRNPIDSFVSSCSGVGLISLACGTAYHDGCTGDKSTPYTSESGYCSPISIAQMPVPVPTSRTRGGLRRGARCRWPSQSIIMIWCLRSMRSSSFCQSCTVNRCITDRRPAILWNAEKCGGLESQGPGLPHHLGEGKSRLCSRDIVCHSHTRTQSHWT